MKMKRSLRIALTVCVAVALLIGIGIAAFAEDAGVLAVEMSNVLDINATEATAVDYTDPSGQYKITGTWQAYNRATGTYEDFTGTFVNGGIYRLNASLTPLEDYTFEYYEISYNGRQLDWDWDVNNGARFTVPFADRWNQVMPDYNVYLSKLPEAKVGQPVTAPIVTPLNMDGTECTDANYTVTAV